jgi:putative ABC transport system permease protein
MNDVKALDRLVFVAMAGTMVAIGVLASYVPAWRASRVDPMVALRGE